MEVDNRCPDVNLHLALNYNYKSSEATSIEAIISNVREYN